MDERMTGLLPREAEAPGETGLAESLMRDEFAGAAPAHRAWFRRDAKEPPVDREVTAVFEDTAPVGVVVAGAPENATAAGAAVIHEEFAEPDRPPRARSHRTGMLAGLGVVGALLAVLVLLGPGSSKPRLPVQSVHDVSPISASGPKTAAATTPSTAAPTTTSSVPGPGTTTTTAPRQTVTVPTTVTYVYYPGTTAPAETPTTSAPAPASAPTTAPPPPAPAPTTTPTTAPPATTTSTTTCTVLGLLRC